MRNVIESRAKAWFADEEASYSLPLNWQIEVFSHKPQKNLTEKEIYQKIQNPIGCNPLSSFLKPGMKVCIISDDISRPTRTDILLPMLINLIEESGVSPKDIKIVIGSGTHPKMTSSEKNLKFGDSVVNKIKIIDHDCKKNLAFVGKTSLGTPVYINKHIIKSHFVIGIGGIYPAKTSGFSGGAKLVLGVCGLKTIRYFHFRRSGVQRGGSLESKFRQDLLEAAKLAGIKFIINNLLSQEREIIDIFAGNLHAAHAAGVEKAQHIYSVSNPQKRDLDIVIADTYPFDTTAVFTRKGWWPLKQCKTDCWRLLISAIPAGIGGHGLMPIVPRRHEKLFKLKTQLQVRSSPQKVKFLMQKLRLQHQSQAKNQKQTYRHQINFFNSLARNPDLPNPDIHFINNLEKYFSDVRQRTGLKEVKVGFYRSSSLTYSK